jgi:hypothetical protein
MNKPVKNFDELGRRCINALTSLKETHPDVWINRLTDFFNGVRKIKQNSVNEPLNLMIIIDVDRLSKVAKGIPELEKYFSDLPCYQEGEATKSVTHDQHLKLLGITLPLIVGMT